jgi:hypothetical protein
MFRRFKIVIIQTLAIVLALELCLRLLGYHGYQVRPFSIVSKPAGSLRLDPAFGFVNAPGQFEITLNDSLVYHASNDSMGYRKTGYQGLSNNDSCIVFIGCSFTYGMGVDDSLSLPYLFQQHCGKSVRVINAAVPGHNTVQSLESLQYLMQKYQLQPDLIVLGFMDFHLERNQMTPTWRQSLQYAFKDLDIPSNIGFNYMPRYIYDCKNMDTLRLNLAKVYSYWPFRQHSALVNAMQSSVEARRHAWLMRYAMNNLNHYICQTHPVIGTDIPLLLYGMSNDANTLALVEKFEDIMGEPTISVLSAPINLYEPKYTNAPYDSHPNAEAHKIMAQQLYQFLKQR